MSQDQFYLFPTCMLSKKEEATELWEDWRVCVVCWRGRGKGKVQTNFQSPGICIPAGTGSPLARPLDAQRGDAARRGAGAAASSPTLSLAASVPSQPRPRRRPGARSREQGGQRGRDSRCPGPVGAEPGAELSSRQRPSLPSPLSRPCKAARPGTRLRRPRGGAWAPRGTAGRREVAAGSSTPDPSGPQA